MIFHLGGEDVQSVDIDDKLGGYAADILYGHDPGSFGLQLVFQSFGPGDKVRQEAFHKALVHLPVVAHHGVAGRNGIVGLAVAAEGVLLDSGILQKLLPGGLFRGGPGTGHIAQAFVHGFVGSLNCLNEVIAVGAVEEFVGFEAVGLPMAVAVQQAPRQRLGLRAQDVELQHQAPVSAEGEHGEV